MVVVFCELFVVYCWWFGLFGCFVCFVFLCSLVDFVCLLLCLLCCWCVLIFVSCLYWFVVV